MRSTLIQNVLDAEPSGAVVTTIGHAHPHVLRAIAEQAAKVTFTHRGAFTSTAMGALADRLTAMTGYAGAWFVNSGSEATEAAMQFACSTSARPGGPNVSGFSRTGGVTTATPSAGSRSRGMPGAASPVNWRTTSRCSPPPMPSAMLPT
ncbi:aminotransferase class III-fold pyridoxal phosphate-dependent enzyme [Streptomyces phaeochromogenes]|uniref:aminotransferase class III-fold pyridoxal phosphate-dependent enzyme n=1 Tax=Streptomyces phaeochromogenes TaxID=1923 RepID=UPI002DD864D2|nr:aminotransferase class III-fold pyridoxal phosphate-dependent enzyme [Streptomyces phaeochromogenes]WRZ34545.1 aminotransferase class III-fold pyridoxal phosphate-dependent enzyme [Streptomyces phaeochromogenes]